MGKVGHSGKQQFLHFPQYFLKASVEPSSGEQDTSHHLTSVCAFVRVCICLMGFVWTITLIFIDAFQNNLSRSAIQTFIQVACICGFVHAIWYPSDFVRTINLCSYGWISK